MTMNTSRMMRKQRIGRITNMYEKTLPIGSVILTKNATKKIMITGYYQYLNGDTSKIYDYVGVAFPEGYISEDSMGLFDHSDIERIYSLGFQDEERFEFEEKLKEAISEK